MVYNAGRDENGQYMVIMEKRSWNDFYNKIHNMYYKRPGDKVYFYSSVFAPNNLKTDIIHKWQKYDENLGTWVEVQKVAYKIEGGRSNGYRGYSFITKAVDGL